MLSTELKNTIKIWPLVSHVLSIPKNKMEYEKTVTKLDELIDEVGDNEKHPLAKLMETLSILIEDYEKENVPELEGDPVTVLQNLMADHKLNQKELPEIGSQGVVSEILHRKRDLNINQIKKLSERFHVSPAVFF